MVFWVNATGYIEQFGQIEGTPRQLKVSWDEFKSKLGLNIPEKLSLYNVKIQSELTRMKETNRLFGWSVCLLSIGFFDKKIDVFKDL